MTGLFAAGLVFLAYALLMGVISGGWYRLQAFKPFPARPSTRISLIVAARNEAEKIGNLLSDLLQQDYPGELLQIILVDDHSEDGTPEVAVKAFNQTVFSFQIIELKSSGKSGKKAAIDTGIQHASGQLVITTDADCRLPLNWISSIAAYYETYHPKMILAPVRFSPHDTLFGKLQALEFMSLMAATAGSASAGMPLMANGANLTYERSAYLECGGFEGNLEYPSGDDLFMMFRIKQKFGPRAIRFLKCSPAIVNTEPAATLGEFFAQRLRWVSKSRGYTDAFIIASAFIVYLTNLLLLSTLVWGIFSPAVRPFSLLFYLFKLAMDFPAMLGIASFNKDRKLLWLLPLMEILNAIYTVVIGLLGNMKSFSWKGRKIHPLK